MVGKNYIIIICLISIVFCTCASNLSHYSSENLQPNKVAALFYGYPAFTEHNEIEQYIIDLQPPRAVIDKELSKKGKYLSLIDENGNVEAIYINKTINTYIDSIIIESIKNSHFQRFINIWKKHNKYSLLLTYRVINGQFTSPLVDKEGNPTSVQFDTLPEPVGGFEAIQKKLDYPEAARRQETQGQVIVYLETDEFGIIVQTKILQSLGPILDESAIKAVKSVEWLPARKNGVPVKGWAEIPVEFKIQMILK